MELGFPQQAMMVEELLHTILSYRHSDIMNKLQVVSEVVEAQEPQNSVLLGNKQMA